MKLTRVVAAIGLAVVILAGRGAELTAWGPDGHRIGCRIAYLLLENDERAEVNRLTRIYRMPDGRGFQNFPDACGFADTARLRAQEGTAGWESFNRFNRWHFLNVSRDTRTVTEALCRSNCVLEGIRFHAARLADRNESIQRRAEALLLLGHWVGDVHQPLHVSFADDLGGNEIRTSSGIYSATHLHGIWDSGILRRITGSGGWSPLATRLAARITPSLRSEWSATPPLQWAQESYALATSRELDYCEWDDRACRSEPQVRRLGTAYQLLFEDDVERRLQMAGTRLAAVLRTALGLH